MVEKPFEADTLLRTVREVLDEDTSCPRAGTISPGDDARATSATGKVPEV
jgi:hypothetical protein